MDPKAGERVSDSWGHRSVACRLQVFKPLSLLLGEGTLPLQNIAAIGGPWGHPTVREVFSSFREHPPPNRRQCPCGPAARPWGRGLKFGLPPKLALRGGFGSSSLSGGWSREVCEGSGTEMNKESWGKGALVGKWVTALGTWGSSPGGQE